MKQMELARRYFEEFGRPMIESQFPQLKDSYAAGLAGEGSGCLGYDDEISQDHDFAPGFCIWLKKMISTAGEVRCSRLMTDCHHLSWVLTEIM